MSTVNLQAPSQLTRPSFFRSLSSSSSSHGATPSKPPRKDKPRLYLAIYPRGGSNLTSPCSSSMSCDSYHWVLLIGPQSADRSAPGKCHQIVHGSPSNMLNASVSHSFYEETDLSQQSQAQSRALLARITVAKVLDENRVRTLLQTVPLLPSSASAHCGRSDSGYETDDVHATSTCRAWVKAAYRVLANDSKCLKTYYTPEAWFDMEEVVRLYAKKKRSQGRFGSHRLDDAYLTWNEDEIPTWNFWENRETTA